MGVEDQSWTDGVADDMQFGPLFVKAEATVLKYCGMAVSKEVFAAIVAVDRYFKLRELHDDPLPEGEFPEWLSPIVVGIKTVRAQVLSGLLFLQLQKEHGNPLKLKNRTMATMRKAKAVFHGHKAVDFMHSTFKKATDAACGMRFAWPVKASK